MIKEGRIDITGQIIKGLLKIKTKTTIMNGRRKLDRLSSGDLEGGVGKEGEEIRGLSCGGRGG